jgi:hypothetical protein
VEPFAGESHGQQGQLTELELELAVVWDLEPEEPLALVLCPPLLLLLLLPPPLVFVAALRVDNARTPAANPAAPLGPCGGMSVAAAACVVVVCGGGSMSAEDTGRSRGMAWRERSSVRINQRGARCGVGWFPFSCLALKHCP